MTRPSLAGIEQRAAAVPAARDAVEDAAASGENYSVTFFPTRVRRALIDSAADLPALTAAVRDVLALHKPEPCGDVDHTPGECAGDAPCIECFVEYPCPTVRAVAAHLDLTDPEGEPT